jgi:hypothetical protein
MHGCLDCFEVNDTSKLIFVQRGSADERAVDIWLIHQIVNAFRGYASAVENSNTFCGFLIVHVRKD